VRIVDVETYVVEQPPQPAYGWREGLPTAPPRLYDLWLRVVTDEGVDGWALVDYYGEVAAAVLGRGVRELAVGADPLRKELLWERMWELDRMEQFPTYAFGALDTALWDLSAKVAGLPLFEVLGGYRDCIPAYASTATFASVEEYLDVADQCLELGYTAIKLHAWGDARRDGELARRLREHVGPDIVLMFDASGGFRPPEAMRLGRALEEAGFLWYEEPVQEFAVEAHRRLADALDIPILGAEVIDGAHYTAAEWLATGAADLIRTEALIKGGITGALRIFHVADAFGTTAEVHGPGLASVHLCCAVPNTTYYESMVLTNPVAREPLVDADGNARAPLVPGIGYEVDVEELRGRAVAFP
jgi:L-alanine-DL-glutamate epimerase-like enolase superfamily enzyme